MFFVQNLIVLQNGNDTSFVTTKIRNFHNENFTYTEEKGLQFAVGLIYPTPEPGSMSPLDILEIYMQ